MRDALFRWPEVPVHAGHDIAKGTLRNILAIIGMDAEEFRKLLWA